MKRRKRQPVGRIHFRMGWAGWLFLASATALGLAALKSQVALLFMLFGAMLGMVVLSAFVSRAMVLGVQVWRDLPQRVWQNQTVPFGYWVRNLRRRAWCLGLAMEEQAPRGVTSVSGYCLSLPPGERLRAGGRFAALRRGRVRLGALRLSTGFPFGLLAAARVVKQPREMIVWPARGRLKQQMMPGGAVETSSAAPSPWTGGQDEFFGLREYRQGDNPRWIHWRKSASRPVLVLREMSRPLPEVLYVVLDAFAGAPDEQVSERLIRFAATVIDHAFGRSYQVGLLATDSKPVMIEAAGSNRNRTALLDALACLEAGGSVSLAESLHHARLGLLRQAQVLVVAVDVSRSKEALDAIARNCRFVSVVTPSTLDDLYEDSGSVTVLETQP